MKNHLQYLATIKLTNPECNFALLEISKNEPVGVAGKVGRVQYASQRRRVPAGKELDATCRVMGGPKPTLCTVLVEIQFPKRIPEDLVVARLLANVKKGCLPVYLLNSSEK